MFPETAGRTLEEIEEVFAQGCTFTAWRINSDVGKKTLEQVVGKNVDVRFSSIFKETASSDLYIPIVRARWEGCRR